MLNDTSCGTAPSWLRTFRWRYLTRAILGDCNILFRDLHPFSVAKHFSQCFRLLETGQCLFETSKISKRAAQISEEDAFGIPAAKLSAKAHPLFSSLRAFLQRAASESDAAEC